MQKNKRLVCVIKETVELINLSIAILQYTESVAN